MTSKLAYLGSFFFSKLNTFNNFKAKLHFQKAKHEQIPVIKEGLRLTQRE